MEPNITKICKKCQKEKPYTEFNKRGRYWYTWCKNCWSKKNCAWQKKNKVRCRESDKRRRDERLAKGLCAKCDVPQLDNVVLCEKHYLMRLGHDRLGRSTTEIASLLKKKLENQGFKCPYTGVSLKLGNNTELDHILPVSRFPEHAEDLDNIQWVSSIINKAKYDRTHEEFLLLCKTVTNYCS